MEIKLTNVARASIEELLADYLDFLRTRNAAIWEKESEEARYVRRMGRGDNVTFATFEPVINSRPPRPWPTWSFASFTRPPACSTAKSPTSKKSSSNTAASANA